VEGARPTPTPDGGGPQGSTSSIDIPALPDLVVSKIEVQPAFPRIGEPVIIQVTIENRGLADVSLGPPPNNFHTDLYVNPAVTPIQLYQDGEIEFPCQAWWVPAGGSWTLQAAYVFTDVRNFNLYAQVDTDDQVEESNEYNNVTEPFSIQVLAKDIILHETHQDFQLTMASSLDLSDPEGVMRLGIFDEPIEEPQVYEPDTQIDHPPDPPAGPTSVDQSHVALASNGAGTLFAIWEDGRNGGVFNRDVYFSRSVGGIDNWLSPDIRVNDDATVKNQIRPDLVYDQSNGRLYAVWQDERNGNYDIYFAYSDNNGDTWINHQKLNDDVGTAAQLNPSIALGPGFAGVGNRVYVVWQDQRNGNDDIYLIRSDDGGVSWSPNYFVTDDPDMTAQNQVAPSVAVENLLGRVIVAWEDWRDPLHPEIYVMWSESEGSSFGIDVPVTIVTPDKRNTYRRAPTLATETTVETIIYTSTNPLYPGLVITDTESTTMTVIHVAWEQWSDGRDGQPDIYYSHANFLFDAELRETCPYPYELAFCFEEPQEVSGSYVDSAYVRPTDGGPVWPIEPSWQGQVSMALVPKGIYTTTCHAGLTQDYSRGVIVAWSDARSFDEWRYEIHTRRMASPGDNPEVFELCEDWAWGMVNDNAKINVLRDDPNLYKIYEPAATGQFQPSILVDQSEVFVAWDDNRYDDPTLSGGVPNRDVFIAKMVKGLNTEGVFISPVLDGRKVDPKWYVLSWWAVTEFGGDVLLQTRFGENPYPPKESDATGGWTAWTGNPSSPKAYGCEAGVDCYYDAPGRRIVDELGRNWFDCPGPDCPDDYRYMQYKVIISGPSRRTALSRVVVHCELGSRIYLPIVVRNR
jgi:hypothetical protein